MRNLILAVQFLTRLPTPQVSDFTPVELANSAAWFPVVGLIVGALVTASLFLTAHIDPWLGALAGLLMWVWVTGALHLDGLADLTDALGASHRDPQRLLQVMRDPHVGAFGVVAVVLGLLGKLILLQLLTRRMSLTIYSIPLICAWSRLGAIAWSAWLPSLSSGSAAAFSWHTNKIVICGNAVILLILSALFAPALLIAPLALFGWWSYLRWRLGGMTGDCLGAGIEVTEIVLLAATLCIPITKLSSSI